MKTKIKNVYQRLTNKELASDDSVISPEAFSSVLLDRFNAELSKMGISWDRSPTSVNSLTAGKSNGITSQMSPSHSNVHISKSDKGFSVGIDLQKIDKFPDVKDPWEEKFYKENFKDIEIGYCLKKEYPLQSFAGIFAAKEAVFKATGIDRSYITILFNEDGKPMCEFASVSISHDGGYANAVAMSTENDAVQKISIPVNESTETVLVPDNRNRFNLSIFLLFLSVIFIITYIIYKEW